ncbi:MAG: caspase, EACC1-associated type [Solirubrobacteraceae bacterium]
MTTTRLTRHALIVATANYNDSRLAQLRSPAADAEGLAEVLSDPDRGDFDVQIGIDETHADLTRKIALFFRDRIPNDLLLLHLSCHGVKDENGELYLAATDTDLDLLSATGISAAWLNERIDRSRSRRTVVLLDCCFSGSFPAGMRHRAGGDMDAPHQLQGRGRAIITASNSMEYAYEGDELTGEGRPSVFTEAVVDGLRTGKADLDMDHLISIDDLYHYVYDRVRERTPNQTPSIKSDLEGVLYLARSSYRAPVVPAKLDPELIARTEDRYVGIREGAVQELASLLSSSDPSIALAAREVLMLLTGDDSRRVAARAQTALEAVDDATEARASEAAGDATQALPPKAPARREPPAPPEPPAARPPQAAPPPRSRRPIAVGVALAAIAAVVIVAIVALSGGGSNGGSGVQSTTGSGVQSTTGAVNASDKIPVGNLVQNPSFEHGLTNWDSNNSTLSTEQAADAPDGSHVVRVTATDATAPWAVDVSPDTVQDSVGGTHYAATAWVKGTDSSNGTIACLTVRERNGDAQIGRATTGTPLSVDSYMELRVPYVAHQSGDRIDIYVFASHSGNGAVGDTFLADALTLVEGDAGQIGSDC